MGENAPERLFRDDGGAALERAARLEDENRELRAEIARLRRPGRDADTVRTTRPTGQPRFFLVGFLLAMAAFGFALVLGGIRHTSLAPRRAPAVRVIPADPVPRPAPVLIELPPPATTGTVLGSSAAAEDDCTQPYWYDARGVKHYKRQCLTR